MTNKDSGEFFRRLDLLRELFDAKFSEAKAMLYFEALKDLPFEAVVHGLNLAAKACTFMPRPAEIRTLAVGDSEDRIEAAWMAFRQAMKRAGSYASLSITDAALGDTIVAMFGSWPAACGQELSQEMWSAKRKEFGRVYRVMLQRQPDGARYLPGVCEQQNGGVRDWQKHVPVYRLDAGGLSQPLSLDEAETERTQIAARASGFSSIKDSLQNLRLMPKPRDESA